MTTQPNMWPGCGIMSDKTDPSHSGWVRLKKLISFNNHSFRGLSGAFALPRITAFIQHGSSLLMRSSSEELTTRSICKTRH